MSSTRVVLTCAAVAVMSLGSCGDDSDDGDGLGGSRDVPVCEEVVEEGAPIPEELFESGCEMPSGDRFLFSAFECADGGKFITYDDRFYGLVGETWHENRGEPAEDPAYTSFLADC